jgi:hypothetical protein
MKFNRITFAIVLSAIIYLVFLNGCKVDIAQPIWEKPYTAPITPKITSVVPAQAAAGISTITINGDDFAKTPGTNIVYFNNTFSEVISSTSTRIVVRRPNVVTDSAVIKVVSSNTLMAVKYFPYKVEQVVEKYGNFSENITLSVVAADSQENVYVIEGNNVHKVSPNGGKNVFATANRSTFDAKLGPDGNLYLMGNNRSIDKVNLATGQVSTWKQLASGKNVRYGDFDKYGNFYTGGIKTDLLVVEPNLNVKTGMGFYSGFEILAVRTFENYVYVAAQKSGYADTAIVYRHQITASGSLGVQEVVLDMRITSNLSSRAIKGISFSSDGLMYLATDAANPIITFDLADKKVDFLYKEILHPFCKSLCWGSGKFIYMINGDATAGEEWTVYKVNVGITGN